MRYRRTDADMVRPPRGARPPAVVAVEVVLLWPRDVGPAVVSSDEAGLWPVFVVVVEDPPDPAAPALPFFDLLDRPKGAGELTVVTGQCRWSIVDPRNALLWCDVHADSPVPFDVRIMLPAERVLGILDLVANGGATIGFANRRHAGRLRGRIDVRGALRDVVLLSCPPSGELTAIEHALLGDRSGVTTGR